MRVGFLGTAEITAAMVRGLLGRGRTITVSPRNAAEAFVAMMIRADLPDRPRGGELPDALRTLSTEGGFNATLRAEMALSREDLRRALDGFRKRLGLPEKDETVE